METNGTTNETIQVKKIKILGNIRTYAEDYAELMNSIRQHGLLQPIGVWKEGEDYWMTWGHRRFEALKRLGYTNLTIGKEVVLLQKPLEEEEWIVLNAIENIQRKDISPIELGRIVSQLKKDYKMSLEEVSARLAINKNRVSMALGLYSQVPASHAADIGFVPQGSGNKQGKIAATTMRTILKAGFNKADLEKMMDYAKTEAITLSDVRLILELIRRGIKFEDAIEEKKKYARVLFDFIVKKDTIKKLQQELQLTRQDVLIKAITGEIKLPKGAIFMLKETGE